MAPVPAVVRLFLLSLGVVLVHAAPIDTPSWLQPMIPHKGDTLADEIKCYSLPYGAIGFLSHILTYWVILWLGFGRRPYWPLKRLSAGKTDMVLAIAQLSISIAIATYTIVRCRQRWQFMLIAIWKLVMSVEVGIFGLRASYKAMKHGKFNYDFLGEHIWSWEDPTSITLLLYALGVITGMTGLLAIVWELRHSVQATQLIQVSAVFFSVTAFSVLVCAIVFCCRCLGGSMSKPLLAIFFIFILVCSLYSDWILGIIAGGLVGVPSGDNAVLYWTYFAAKRLPLLMT